jgi:hypothetical protein
MVKNMSIIENQDSNAEEMSDEVADAIFEEGFELGVETVSIKVISAMLADNTDRALIAKYFDLPSEQLDEIISVIEEEAAEKQ